MLDAQILLNLIEDNDLALFIKDRNMRYHYINESGAAMLGREVSDVIGRTDAEIFDAPTTKLMWERDRSILASSGPAEFDSLGRVQNRWMLFHTVKTALPGNREQLLGVSANITAFRDRSKLDVCHLAFGLLKKEGPALAAHLTNLKCRLLIPF